MFEVGDIVECIQTCDASGSCICGCSPKVVRGTYYKVLEIMFYCPQLDSGVGLKVNANDHWWWCSSIFRKPERNIDIFKLAEPRREKLPEPELEPA